jgi:hypothetical protein
MSLELEIAILIFPLLLRISADKLLQLMSPLCLTLFRMVEHFLYELT